VCGDRLIGQAFSPSFAAASGRSDRDPPRSTGPEQDALRRRTDGPSDAAIDAPTDTPLGIICGSGHRAYAVADAWRLAGRRVMMVSAARWADATAAPAYPNTGSRSASWGDSCARPAEAAKTYRVRGGWWSFEFTQLRLDWGT